MFSGKIPNIQFQFLAGLRFNMILMIDNYDSFTYNLVQYLGELGAEVETVRNDAITTAQIRALNPSGIVISPGPCTPDDAGISLAVVAELGEMYPDFWCLSWPPVYRPGAWRHRGASGQSDAWQDFDDAPSQPGCVCRSATAV